MPGRWIFPIDADALELDRQRLVVQLEPDVGRGAIRAVIGGRRQLAGRLRLRPVAGRGRRVDGVPRDHDRALVPVDELRPVIEDDVAAIDALAQRHRAVDARDRPHHLQDVVVLRQVVGVAAGIVASQRQLLRGRTLRSQIPGRHQLVAVDRRQSHDAIDGRADVAVGAVALVVEDAASPVPGHAAEADRSELGVHLCPGALGADAGDESVLPDLRGILVRRHEIHGRVAGRIDRVAGRRRAVVALDAGERVGRRSHDRVVDDVDLGVHAHLIGDVERRLEAETRVRAADVLRGAVAHAPGRVTGRARPRAVDRRREGREAVLDPGDVGGHGGVALPQEELVHVVGAQAQVAVQLEDLHAAAGLLGVAAQRFEVAGAALLGRFLRRALFLLLP